MFGGGTYRPEMPNSFDDSVLPKSSYNGDINSIAGMFGGPQVSPLDGGFPGMGGGQDYGYDAPAPYNGGMMSPKRVINQVGKPGFQPRPTMQSAFSPDNNDFGGGGFMGGSGSMFGGGGFAGK